MPAQFAVVSYPGNTLLLMATNHDASQETNLLLQYRSDLAAALAKTWDGFDKLLTTLAAGSLGLSIGFVHEIVPEPTHVRLLLTAWVSWAASLVVVLASYLSSAFSHHSAIDEVDEDLRSDTEPPARTYGGKWGPWTRRLNVSAALLFFVGVGVFTLFAIINVV